jgi:AAA+ superfamily predicted ATPase
LLRKSGPREICIQWLERVGFTFSPFAFIFGTTFLFAALASTLQKQAGRQWLQTLSHEKLPGLTENKVSQTSSWVFLESVLSQYINRDNSLLVSTTCLSQAAPYSTKIRKAMPRTLGPFLGQLSRNESLRSNQTGNEFALASATQKQVQPELHLDVFARAKTATSAAELETALAGTEPTFRMLSFAEQAKVARLPQKGIQIQLSPLWSHHLKKDFLGVFPLRRTNSAGGRSDKGFATLGLSQFSEPTLNKSKISRFPERRNFRFAKVYGYPFALLRSKGEAFGRARKGFSYLGNLRRGLVKPAQSASDQNSIIAPELKRTLTWPWYKITAYHPPNHFIVPTWNDYTTTQVDSRRDIIRAKPAKTNLRFVNGAVEYAPKKVIQANSGTLTQINFNTASASNEQTLFGYVNTDVERLRLEDDSIPSKKDSIYSKKKIHQDTLSARVLNVVKKGFYDYGLSIPHFCEAKVRALSLRESEAQPPTWVASRTRALLESSPAELDKLFDSKTDEAEVSEAQVTRGAQKLFTFGKDSVNQKLLDAERRNRTGALRSRASRQTLAKRKLGSVPTISSTKPVAFGTRKFGAERLELGLIFKNIAIPKKSFWEYAHYISGYNFPELQDHEVADLFRLPELRSGCLQRRQKLRFGQPRTGLKVGAALQSKEGLNPRRGLPELRSGNFDKRKLRPSKVGKDDKLGLTPHFCEAKVTVNSWFCAATNEVFYTPYLIKVPPKVLLSVLNKTESISPQENAPFSPGEHESGSDFIIEFPSGQGQCSATQSKDDLVATLVPKEPKEVLLGRGNSPVTRATLEFEQEGSNHGNSNLNSRMLSLAEQAKVSQAKVRGARIWSPTGEPKDTFGKASTAQADNLDCHRGQPLVEGFTIRYTPLDLKQENRVRKAFKELGRDYSDYLKQPKDSLPALLLSPSLEEDKQIEEEEFQRLAQEKAAAKAAAKRTQNEEEYNTGDSSTIEEDSDILDPLEVSLRKGKSNVSNLEEEPLNDEEIEDSRFERLRFTRELETKKEEEDCRGIALSLTRRDSNPPMGGLEGGTPIRATQKLELPETSLLRSKSAQEGSKHSLKTPLLAQTKGSLLRSKSAHEQKLWPIRRPNIAQFASKKLEPKVSDRKHSFFGQRSFWPTRLFSQEERLVSAHVINPYIRYDQRNPWLILEQGGVLPSSFQTNQTDNSPTSYSASSSAKLSTSADLCLDPLGLSKTRAVNSQEPSSGSRSTLHTKICKSEDLQNLKNLQTQARLGLIRFVQFPVVESASYIHKTGNQNRIYKSDPRLRLTPLESSLSADWRIDRKVEASPFRVTSKDRVYIVLPKLSENQWQKSVEWQLKRHFLDEDTRLESLVSTEPFKTFKVKKIERSLPWLTMAGTGELSPLNPLLGFAAQNQLPEQSSGNLAKRKGESYRLANSNLNSCVAKVREARVTHGSREGSKKPSFNLFQWPYKTVGVFSPLGLSDRGSASSIAGCTLTLSLRESVSEPIPRSKSTAGALLRRASPAVLTRDNGLPITFLEEGSCPALLSTALPPSGLLDYSRIPLSSSFTTYSTNCVPTLSMSSNPFFEVTNKLFSNQGDLNTELLFEVPSPSSWFLIYRLFLALILKEVFKYIYRISLKDFFIRIINSDFGRTITSPEFRQSVQFEPFPEFYKPKKRLKDLIGIKNALLPLSEIIWFLRNNCRSRNGPHGVILLGPEGVDTTAIAQAVAGEAKVPIIVQSLRALTLTHSHPQKRLEKVLRLARAQSPCVLFLDELDVIGQSREGVIRKSSGDGNSLISLDSSQFVEGATQLQSPDEQTTSQGRRVDLMLRLLTVMDGLHHLNGVVIITTSKNTATLDPALLRPGRFDRLIHLTLPDYEQRMELFKARTRALGHTNNLPLDKHTSLLSVDELEYLSLRTANMSAADIVSAINYSTLRAIVNETVHTVETLEYGLNCVKALKDKQGPRDHSLVTT